MNAQLEARKTRGPITPCQKTSAGRAGAGCGERLPVDAAGGAEPRCIAPPRLDGHTRLACTFGVCQPGELADLLTELQTPRTREEARREKRRGPLVRRLPTGEHAECIVSGVRRQMVSFHVHDVVFFTMNTDTGEARLQFKAHALWAVDDQREHVLRWSDAWSDMLGGSIQWRVTGIELCADFTGLRWTAKDATRFVGRYKRENIRTYQDSAERVETINIGSRSSNVSWCLYDKTTQIDSAKDGRNLPTYRSTWEAHGWTPEQNVSRVELRLCARGLAFEDDAGTELDLTQPENLTAENLRRVWAHACERYRMTTDDATRKTRCSTDPRWLAVARAVETRAERLRQSRAVAEDAHAERVRRSARGVALGLRRLAALHGVRVIACEGLDTMARFADTLAAREIDAAAYGEAYEELQRPALGQAVGEARERLYMHTAGDISGLEETANDDH